MNTVLRAGTASLLTVVLFFMNIMTGCKSAEPPPPQSQAAAPAQAPSPAPPQISIDDLVAPVALYPDQLLAQILTASTNAQEVLDGGNWLLQNQNLKGDALTNAAKQAGFSPSMQYLMSFPQVVDNMCQQIDWTRELGQNFQADQKGVMDAVQRKRAQAQQTGNLKSSPQMTVDTKTADNGQPYVEIKPADPKVVYVPQYNPVTIYNTPAPATVVVTQPGPASAIRGQHWFRGRHRASLVRRWHGNRFGNKPQQLLPLPRLGIWWRLLWRPSLLSASLPPRLPGLSPSLWISSSTELSLEPVQPKRQRDREQQLLQQVQQQHRQHPKCKCEQYQREQPSAFGRKQSGWRAAELERSIHLSGGSPEQC